MPKLKQPTTLQENAFKSSVNHAVNCFDRLRVAGQTMLLSENRAVIKEHVRNRLSHSLFVKFCEYFLYEFYTIENNRPIKLAYNQYELVFNLMMNVGITGSNWKKNQLIFLGFKSAEDLQLLELIDESLDEFWNLENQPWDKFRLENLTTLILLECTDKDLRVIGQRCPKLQVLMINHSGFVTDAGLFGLYPCTELRVINLDYYYVSDKGINLMLSSHEKLEEFNMAEFSDNSQDSFDILSRHESLVCPSIERFSTTKGTDFTNEHIYSIVTIFPNLSHLRIGGESTADLCVLNCLSNLTKLEIHGYFEKVNLQYLLIDIGSRITHLDTHKSNVPMTQDDLNFIFKHCSNIESLEFQYEATKKMNKLIIPPFKKLKQFKCVVSSDNLNPIVTLDFGEMLELESLRIYNCDPRQLLQMIESIMFDNIKFPNLKKVRISHCSDVIADRINRTAKNHNLDFLFKVKGKL